MGTNNHAGPRLLLAAAIAALAMLATLAGAPARAATADPRPDPDACTLLTSMDLEPLLLAGAGGVIDGYNYYPAPGMATCKWLAQPNNHAADAVRRTAMLAFYHIADARRAQAQLDRQPRGDIRPSMAISGGGDDAVARPSPTIVVARHGADIAIIDAGGAELSDTGQMETRYLLDALALKAAGATVKPPPWVETGHVAKMVPLAPTGSLAGWTPPPQRMPGGGAVLDPIIHGLKLLADWRYGLMTVLMPFAVVLLVIRRPRRRSAEVTSAEFDVIDHHRPVRRWPTWLAFGCLALLILNMLFGSTLATQLIDCYGETGAASVTGRFATSTQYNRHDVIGYWVLIGTADRRVVAGEYRTDDFNVLGLGDTGIYPDVGDVFTVRYLPSHPQEFVIRNDDQSPWARKLACTRLAAWHGEASRRTIAAPGNATFRAELTRASQVEHQAGCTR